MRLSTKQPHFLKKLLLDMIHSFFPAILKMRGIDTLPKSIFHYAAMGKTGRDTSFLYLLRNLSYENIRKTKKGIEAKRQRRTNSGKKQCLKNCQSTKSCRKLAARSIILRKAVTEKLVLQGVTSYGAGTTAVQRLQLNEEITKKKNRQETLTVVSAKREIS